MHHKGSVEVICGSMFSGKTDELIRRLRRAVIARQKVQVFKPAIDVRYAVEKVTSHAGTDFAAIPVEKAVDIPSRVEKDVTVVAIDEAQFFDDKIIPVVEKLAAENIRHLDREALGPKPRAAARPADLLAEVRPQVLERFSAVVGFLVGRRGPRTGRRGAPAGRPRPVLQDVLDACGEGGAVHLGSDALR